MGGRYFDLYTRQHGLESNLFLAPGEGDAVIDRETPVPRMRGAEDPDPLGLMRGGR